MCSGCTWAYLSTTLWRRVWVSAGPRILNFGTRQWWVVSFTVRPLYPRCTLDSRLNGPQDRSGHSDGRYEPEFNSLENIWLDSIPNFFEISSLISTMKQELTDGRKDPRPLHTIIVAPTVARLVSKHFKWFVVYKIQLPLETAAAWGPWILDLHIVPRRNVVLVMKDMCQARWQYVTSVCL
jgi:hypothetical protein